MGSEIFLLSETNDLVSSFDFELYTSYTSNPLKYVHIHLTEKQPKIGKWEVRHITRIVCNKKYLVKVVKCKYIYIYNNKYFSVEIKHEII